MSSSGPASTPMMDQYLRMKKGLPEDVLLFFRLGDFYEMFFEDAKEASAILGLTLTKRHGIPMCGVPHHSAEGYIGRLVKGGKRVAIAEQTTIPQPGKLVERELTRVISAGTLADMNLLDSSRHNYIVALYRDKKRFGLACVDHTTGGIFRGPVRTHGFASGRAVPHQSLRTPGQRRADGLLPRNPPHALLRRIYFSAFHGHSQFAEPFPGAFPGRLRLRGDDCRPGCVRRGAPLSELPAPPPYGPFAPHFRARHGERRAD